MYIIYYKMKFTIKRNYDNYYKFKKKMLLFFISTLYFKF